MVTEQDVQHIAELADVGINKEELGTFTSQFNAILDYFDTLDTVKGDAAGKKRAVQRAARGRGRALAFAGRGLEKRSLYRKTGSSKHRG